MNGDINRKLLYFYSIEIENYYIFEWMIKRVLLKKLEDLLYKGKALLLFGARQVGKTTVLEQLVKSRKESVLLINGDEPDIREIFQSITSTQLKNYLGQTKLLIIDEAQRIENIGLTLKLITDQLKDIQVIATGSSTFEMINKMNEPLTGRKFEFTMYPLSFAELVNHHGLLEEKRHLEQRMIFGSYPEIVQSNLSKEKLLSLIADSYLYKDLLMLETVKRPKLLEKLLKALALQVGSEVSFNEIGQLVGADKGTVEKYIQLFEQTFIVFQIPSYSKNIRNELRKSKKIYFYDNGIRNAVIGNFNDISKRSDTGQLWENYLIAERIKHNAYAEHRVSTFFWRTTQQQEIDLIEEDNNQLTAFEFKWNKKAKAKISKTFTNAYPNSKTQLVTPANYEEFLISKDH